MSTEPRLTPDTNTIWNLIIESGCSLLSHEHRTSTAEKAKSKIAQIERERDEAREKLALALIPTTVGAVEREEWRHERDQLRQRVAELENDKEPFSLLSASSKLWRIEKFNDERGDWWEVHGNGVSSWNKDLRQAIDNVMKETK